MMREGWREVRVSDVADVIGGGTPKSGDPEAWGGDVPWVTPADLAKRPSRFTVAGSRFITEIGLQRSAAKMLPAGAVLLTSRAPVGYVTVAASPISTNQGFRSLVLHDGQLPEFWYYLLGHSTEYLNDHAGGSTFKELSGSTLKALTFVIPPLAEQRRIVDLIAAVDDAIEAAEGEAQEYRSSRIAALTAYASSKATHRASFESLSASVIGGVWGDPPTGSGDVAVFGGSAFQGGATCLDVGAARYRSIGPKALEKRALRDGDIILEVSGGSPTQPVGRVIRADGLPMPSVPSNFMRLVRPNTDAAEGYLFWSMWLRYQRGETATFQRHTTGIRNLQVPSYLGSEVPVLSGVDDQAEFVELAQQAEESLDAARAHAESLRTLRSNLLTVLLSGEHEIPESYDHLLDLAEEGAAA